MNILTYFFTRNAPKATVLEAWTLPKQALWPVTCGTGWVRKKVKKWQIMYLFCTTKCIFGCCDDVRFVFIPDICHNLHNRRWCTYFKPVYLFPQRTQKAPTKKLSKPTKYHVCLSLPEHGFLPIAGQQVALFDTLVFLLNEYFIKLNTANFYFLNEILNWIFRRNVNWIIFLIGFC